VLGYDFPRWVAIVVDPFVARVREFPAAPSLVSCEAAAALVVGVLA